MRISSIIRMIRSEILIRTRRSRIRTCKNGQSIDVNANRLGAKLCPWNGERELTDVACVDRQREMKMSDQCVGTEVEIFQQNTSAHHADVECMKVNLIHPFSEISFQQGTCKIL